MVRVPALAGGDAVKEEAEEPVSSAETDSKL
jgi:hypothetical protein